eukprot:TRINITY_DN6761_c0_g1_i1.p2 TRINITY_DN6761_c0_g1~~TRINITY_DN6761_c0_g1_i1.p2  ORF type:complete len:437 (-),score=135.31 TRINITY_DN6761_c0_g1_i1:17-1327(-)
MSDNESDQPRKKRVAERQLVKDGPESDSEDDGTEPTTWEKADSAVLEKRKRYRVKRKDPNAAAVEASAAAASSSTSSAAAAPNPQLFTGFTFNATANPTTAASPLKSEVGAKVAEEKKSGDASTESNAAPATPDKSASEIKAPAFDFKSSPAFTFTSAITPTTATAATAAAAAAAPKDAAAPAFQFSTSFTSQAVGATPFKFTFPLANAAAPDMQVQPNAGTKPIVGVSTFQIQAPLNLFGKDIAKPAEPVGGFTFAAPAAPAQTADDAEEPEDPEAAQPTVVLAPSVTGEEDEESLFQEKCKLYEFDKESKQWVEKGKGVLKLNKHKTNNKVRVLMRTEPAHRLAINGVLLAGIKASVDAKRPKVVSLTLPATYIMGHENSPASEMCVLSLRFLEDTHGTAFVSVAQPFLNPQPINNQQTSSTTDKPSEPEKPAQ